MTPKRPELADFLRRSRERLAPRDVGPAEGPRRRTPGLRREEVAVLAGMSADYYMRLEQARGPQPSVQVLAALTGALRLTEDERDHLYVLAGHRPPEGARAGGYLRPGLRYLLDRLDGVPVQVVSDLGDLLAQNDLALALFGCVCSVAEEDRNIILRWFTDPVVRGHFAPEEHEEQARQLVADLRAAAARRGGRRGVPVAGGTVPGGERGLRHAVGPARGRRAAVASVPAHPSGAGQDRSGLRGAGHPGGGPAPADLHASARKNPGAGRVARTGSAPPVWE